MKFTCIDGKLQFDIPVIKPMSIADEKMILDIDKTTLIKGDEKMVLTGDEIGFYFKDEKYAILKQDIVKVKLYRLKRFLNNVFKTKFKLNEQKTMLHILNDELYKKFGGYK